MASFYKAPTINFYSSTLNGAVNDSVGTITLNSVTGLQFPGVLIIDREDGNGTATPSSREVISYTGISGSDLTGCTRAFDNGTARSHSNGALVEATFTVGMWNDLRTAVAASLTTDGTGVALSGTASIATLKVSNFISTSGASINIYTSLATGLEDLLTYVPAEGLDGDFAAYTAVRFGIPFAITPTVVFSILSGPSINVPTVRNVTSTGFTMRVSRKTASGGIAYGLVSWKAT